MVVNEAVVAVGRGLRFGQDLDERPAGMREVDRARRQACDRIDEVHLFVEIPRIGAANRVGQVKEDRPGEFVGVGPPLGAIERAHEVEEFDR